MARNTTTRIMVAYAADERFVVVIRPQPQLEWGVAQLKAEFATDCGFVKSDWPGHPHLSEEAARLCKITSSGE